MFGFPGNPRRTRWLWRSAAVSVVAGATAAMFACSDRPTEPTALAPMPPTPQFSLATDGEGPGACMGDDAFAFDEIGGMKNGSDLNCTSNDIDIAKADITAWSTDNVTFTPLAPGDTIPCTLNQTLYVKTIAELRNNATQRWDVGIWIADAGGTSAVTGQCSHYHLPVGTQGVADFDGDDCGDMQSTTQTGANTNVDLDVLTIQCTDPDQNGLVDVPACLGWLNSANPGGGRDPVCPVGGDTPLGYRYGTTPETKAKCNCEPFHLPIKIKAKLIVIKHVINDDGGTKTASDFTMNVTAVNPDQTSFPGAESPGTEVIVDAGAYSVDEGAHDGYTKSLSADCSGTIAQGETKTCTITNDDIRPQLTVIKHVINDDGGTAVAGDFTMNVTATNPDQSSFAGAESPGTTIGLDAGAYSVDESAFSGYTKSLSSDCSGTIAVGESKTCTITNDDQPAGLIVIKHVINDDGGTKTASDFTMNVTATNPSPSSFPGEESPGTNVSLDPGSYSVDEGAHDGYTKSLSADCSGTIALGETKTCTITNDDIRPQLTVIKHVINDDGGTAVASDFTMNVTATNPDQSSFAGAESPGTTIGLDAGAYSVDESAFSGYTKSLSADCSGTIAVGESKTCTITNDDIRPQLTVIKHVINDNGGTAVASDFTMQVTATNPDQSSFPGAESPGTTIGLDAGAYSVDEAAFSGYTKSLSADCSGTIAVGESKTCTITNDDIAQAMAETAWAANGNSPGSLLYNTSGSGNWATYVKYDGVAKLTTLFVGQTEPAGTVQFSAPSGGMVTITINLSGWHFVVDGIADVLVQDYASAPSGNPSPGQFDWKFSATNAATITFQVPLNNYYGVHAVVVEN